MHLRPCNSLDVSSMADIMAVANIDDALSRHMTRDIFKYWTSYRKGCVRYIMCQMAKVGAVSWVLETDEGDLTPDGKPGPGGEVVGWAVWFREGRSPVAKNWQRAGEAWGNRIERGLLAIKDKYYEYIGRDPTNRRREFTELFSILDKPFDPEVFAEGWELNGLNVAPPYQRRGLAKIMLKWGLDQAAAEGVPAFVKSSPAGVKVYEQMGFRSFEQMDFGVFNPGGRGMHSLVWEPPGMEGRYYDRAKRKIDEEKEKKKSEKALEAATS